MLVAPNLYKSLPFDPVRDFVPITKLGFSPAVIIGWGIFAPARTPPTLVKQLNANIVKVVESPAAEARLANYGVTTASSTLEQFGAEVRNERRVLAEMARNAGIKPE